MPGASPANVNTERLCDQVARVVEQSDGLDAANRLRHLIDDLKVATSR